MIGDNMHWEEFDKYEYRLKDEKYGYVIAQLLYQGLGDWCCRFYNDDFEMRFKVTLLNMRSAEEAKICATRWIKDACNNIAYSFCMIRDRLPDEAAMYREWRNKT